MKKRASVAIVSLLATLGCGTAVFEHRIQVAVDDPAKKLGPPPVEVSIFDHQMGYSEDWAKKSMRPTSASAPYVQSLTTTGTVSVGSSPRPKDVTIAVALPRLSTEGYYLFTAELPAEQDRDAKASFVRYGEYFPDPGAPTVGVRYRAEPDKKGWRVFIVVAVN
jgi:hypothetical protein